MLVIVLLVISFSLSAIFAYISSKGKYKKIYKWIIFIMLSMSLITAEISALVTGTAKIENTKDIISNIIPVVIGIALSIAYMQVCDYIMKKNRKK